MFDNAPLLRSLQVQFASYGINAAQYAAELLQPQLVEESLDMHTKLSRIGMLKRVDHGETEKKIWI